MKLRNFCLTFYVREWVEFNAPPDAHTFYVQLSIYTVNHKKGTLFILGITWPNVDQTLQYLAEKICNIFMLCCSPHLFSVFTLPQDKVPFNYACESVPLTAAIMLMIKTYRLNKTIQIHNAYVSVITGVRSVHLRQIHNSEGVYATRRWPRQLRTVALQTTLQPIAASDFAIINIMAAVNGTDSRVHAQLNGTLLSCGKVNTLNRCGEQHNTNMLQIFSATFLPNIVKFDQVISKSRKGALFYGSQCSNAYIRAQHSRV